jgi:cation diffusion facilitator family transporter
MPAAISYRIYYSFKEWRVAAGGSKIVVYAAAAANFGIAVAKFIGAYITGSSAMLSEAIHSLVDTSNQALLLYGLKRGEKPADAKHPFGYGFEVYFWSFIVAMVLFSIGAGVAIYEGIDKIRHPHPIEHPTVIYAILIAAIFMEGGSFWMALKEFNKQTNGRGWWRSIKESKDPVVFTVLLEDTAAMAGLAIALLGVFLSIQLNMPALDGWASVAIGIILAIVAMILAKETKSLLIGEAASDELTDNVRALIAQTPGITGVLEVLTLHMGPSDVLVTAHVDFVDTLTAADVERTIADMRRRVQTAHSDVKRLFIEARSLETHQH